MNCGELLAWWFWKTSIISRGYWKKKYLEERLKNEK